MESQFYSLLLSAHIHGLVSEQVNREYESNSYLYEEIYDKVVTASEDGEEVVFVFEWWTVSQDFAFHAQMQGEVVVDTPFGIIWGRQTTGLALELDMKVNRILSAISCHWGAIPRPSHLFSHATH